jgi:hypothetical protein
MCTAQAVTTTDFLSGYGFAKQEGRFSFENLPSFFLFGETQVV